ncbi:MAG TPA: plastocyanin/azurin family copper-binding protein [Gemmatimonadales bacterium]|nr:plastocyanin/azurin family copper-binding protein [Gemmatimonadales bacterium]
MRFVRQHHLTALAILLGALACGGNGGGGTGPCTPGMATQLAKTTGDPAAWYHNNPLPAPLSVTVKDANSCAVPGVVVNWSIITGGGGLSAAQSTTNSSGIATILDSVGVASPQVVHAASGGLPTADFQVTSVAAPTAVDVTVGNNFFSTPDTAVQVGGTVTWTWSQGSIGHNVTYTSGPAPLPASSNTQSTGTFSTTFTTLGTYGYHCTIHPGQMTGSLTVVH